MTVSFNKQQERIKVPFAALSAFVDPSVRFGLQFDRRDKATERRSPPTSRKAPPRRPRCRCRRSAAGCARAARRPRPRARPTTAEAAKPEDAASKVVKLDSFRKK